MTTLNILSTRSRSIQATLGLLCLVGAAGCSGSGGAQVDASPQIMIDRQAHYGTRTREIREIWESVELGEVDREGARDLLKKVAWQRASSSDLRELAINKLLEDTANLDDTRTMFGYMLPTESRMGHLGVLEIIRDAAVENQWGDLKGPLVRSLEFDVPAMDDADRPEHQALAGLSSNGDALASVYDVFSGPTSEYSIAKDDSAKLDERMQAWALLTRLDPTGHRVLELVRATEIDDSVAPGVRTLIEDAQLTASIFNTVPTSPEQLAWANRLRAGSADNLWERGEAMLASLDRAKREGVRLRHVPGLLWASEHAPDLFASSRGEILASLESSLDGTRKYLRESGPGSSDGKRELLYDWKNDLTWADLVLLEIAWRATRDSGVARAIFSQADRDHTDRTTEYGGTFFATADGFEPRLYPPRPTQRYGDGRFVAPHDMIVQSDGAVFHYHFQVQEHNNGNYAGPSKGDFEYAERYGRSCLVWTFVSKDKINIDYYQPGGARIDLGAIDRPGS